MGNSVGTLNACFCSAAGDISVRPPRHRRDALDEGIGHSFCYIRPPESFAQDDVVSNLLLPTISGVSVSTNTTNPLSTALFDPASFASVPLQPISRSLISSGPLLRNPGSGSILPMDRSLFSGSLDKKKTDHALPRKLCSWLRQIKTQTNQMELDKGIKDSILAVIWGPTTSFGKKKATTRTSISSCSSSGANLSSQGSLCEDENFLMEEQNLQWAHGKAGEDRVHMVVSEEHNWVFVGSTMGSTRADPL